MTGKKFHLVIAAIVILAVSLHGSLAAIAGPALEIASYPAELSLEKGWLKYVTVSVNNSGSVDLHGVSLQVEGIPRVWVEQLQADKVDVLPAGSAATFTLKITVPIDARTQRYIIKFAAASDEASDEKISDVKVFGSKSEVLLQEIQTLRSRLNYLNEIVNIGEREGKNATRVREKLNRAGEILTIAESYLYKKMYDEDVELLRSARALLDISERDMEHLPESTGPLKLIPRVPEGGVPLTVMAAVVGVAVLGSVVVLFFAFKSAEKFGVSGVRKTFLRALKTSIPEGPVTGVARELQSLKVEAYVEEKTKLARLISSIESDYRQGTLSKESFAELKLKYEAKLADLASRRKASAASEESTQKR